MRSARLAVAGLVLAAGVAVVAQLFVLERRAASVAGPTGPVARNPVSRAPKALPRESRAETVDRQSVALPAPVPASVVPDAEPEVSEHAAEKWSITIVGRVVDESGAPIEGAVLETRDITDPSGEGVPRALSDATGALVALLDADDPWNTIGWTWLQVHAPAHTSHLSWLQVQDGMTMHLGTLVLAGGADVSGVVRDENGAPVANASVTLLAPTNPIEDEEPAELDGEELNVTRTDAQGRYRLRGAPAREVFVGVGAEGRLSTSTEPFLLHAGEDVTRDLVLRSDGVARVQLRVRIIDPHGSPVPGARLDWEKSESENRYSADEQADEQGEVRLSVQRGGSVRLWASDPDERWRPALEERRLAEADALFDVVLGEPVYVSLVVADDLGRPLPWSNVNLSSERMDGKMRPLGADGRLRILLPQERFSVRAFAPGYADAAFGPYDPRTVATDVPLVLRLSPGLAVGGRVLAAGVPVPGAAVSLRCKKEPELSWVSSEICSIETPFGVAFAPHGGRATTDSDGAFVISVHNDGWYEVLVETSGFPVQAFGPFEVRGAASSAHELVLAQGGALEGRLIVPPGERAADRLVGASNGTGMAFTAPVDEDGYYRIENLAPGPYQVRGCHPPVALVHELMMTGNTTGEIVFDCAVREGATTRFDVDLSAEGSVVLEGWFGAPPGQDRWASLRDDTEGRHDWSESARTWTEVDRDGRFRLAVSRPGRYWLVIQSEDSVFRQRLTLEPGTQEWSTSPSWGSISVRHQPQGGGPLKQGPLVLSWSGPADASYEVTQWNNHMSSEPRPPVPFPAGQIEVLRVVDDVREPLREPLTLLAGEELVLDLSR